MKKNTVEVPVWYLVVGFSLAVLLAAFALKRCAGNQSASLPGL
jgi:hypothetical protein